MTSRIVDLARFLKTAGVVDNPVFTPADEEAIAKMEASGMLENPDAIARYLKIPKAEDADYVRKPVSARAFLTDPYYAGQFAQEGRGLYPVLRTRFEEIFDEEEPKAEVILTGSIGWGKSYTAGWIMFYVLYRLSCLRDPHTFCGVEQGTPIVLLNLSVTGQSAKNTIFATVRNLVDASPYFREHFPRDYSLMTILRFRVHNPKDPNTVNEIVYQAGNSSEFSAIGQNVICGVIDEANFMVSAHKGAHEKLQGDVEHAMVLYRALTRRTMSRYMFSRGFRGFIVLCSSVMYEDDFIQMHIKRVSTRTDVAILSYSHWDVRRPEMYCGEKFSIALGSASHSSKILAPGDQVAEGVEVVAVPVEYRQAFETDLDGSIRDILGRATLSINPYMNREAIIRQEITEFDGHPLCHPFGVDQPRGIDMEAIGSCFETLRDSLCEPHSILENRKRIRIFKPRRRPECPRFVHFDLSLNDDACGMAMAYVAGTREVVRSVVTENGVSEITERVPIIVFELLVSIVAPIGGMIKFSELRNIVYYIQEPCNFTIASVSFDQFQSADSKQILQAQGLTVLETSVDRTIEPYDLLRNGINEGWIYFYHQTVAHRELIRLQRVVSKAKKVKVDHPMRDSENPRGKGSKDVTDCMAAVVADIMERGSFDTDMSGIRPYNAEHDAPPVAHADQWDNPDDSWILPEDMRGS